MTLITYKALAALLIFLSSLVAVIYPIKTHLSTRHSESLELGEAFASGIFLGVAFFHMLPTSISAFHHLYPTMVYPLAELICILGFISLLFLERLALLCSCNPSSGIPYILTLMLIIHSLIEGTALGVNPFMAEALMIFIAIIAHKGSASFALCVTLIRHKLKLSTICAIVFLFSLVTPLGIYLGTSLNQFSDQADGQLLEAIFNAFATGSFFYMATLHHVQFHKRAAEESHGLLEFFCLVLGLVLMAAVALWV